MSAVTLVRYCSIRVLFVTDEVFVTEEDVVDVLGETGDRASDAADDEA
jgi:hypothetical protein